jgi:release factor glutamine methyltransferase
MTTREAYQELLLQLSGLYDDSEASNITDLVIEYITSRKRIDRITDKDAPLTHHQQSRLAGITEKLLGNTPVQYVLNEAWFAGMKLYVDEHVLIPRPETEELVQWIVDEAGDTNQEACTVLDIGTGSGCIPVALKKKLAKAAISAIDVSEGALNVAIKNAMIQGVQVYFMRVDFLDEHTWKNLGKFDIIISNPPYIKLSEACTMSANVLRYEPHLALFVPDEDALLFYRKIAAFAKEHLEENGSVFLEINEALGKEVTGLFTREGFETELRKDMQGKDRMVKAKWAMVSGE